MNVRRVGAHLPRSIRLFSPKSTSTKYLYEVVQKKKNYFSILPFPFHILFREQERSFAKRVVAQSLIKLIELNKNIYM